MRIKLSKKIITQFILKYIPESRLGRKLKVPCWQILKAIFYRIKTGCQWRELPMKEFFSFHAISWQTVYYHFNKWAKMGVWENVWKKILLANKACLDLSVIALDGSHTMAKNGGVAVGYQRRKKAKTTNMLFLTDKRGLPISISEPIAGNHNDLFEIDKHFKKMLQDLRDMRIPLNGLFLNADAGFDSKKVRGICHQNQIIDNIDINKRNRQKADYEPLLDVELYKERFTIERTNAWIDAYKALLVRFETKADTWSACHYIAFIAIFINKHF